MAATTNPADVRRAAMDLLARREHSVEQLRQKLARRFGRDPELDQVIVEQLDRLVDEGLLSDSRFAAAMLRQLVLKGLGPRRLDGELRQRGIDQGWQLCAEAAELDIDWFEQARVVYSKKFPRPYRVVTVNPDVRNGQSGRGSCSIEGLKRTNSCIFWRPASAETTASAAQPAAHGPCPRKLELPILDAHGAGPRYQRLQMAGAAVTGRP